MNQSVMPMQSTQHQMKNKSLSFSLIRRLRDPYDSQHTCVPELEGNYTNRILTRLEDVLPTPKKIKESNVQMIHLTEIVSKNASNRTHLQVEFGV